MPVSRARACVLWQREEDARVSPELRPEGLGRAGHRQQRGRRRRLRGQAVGKFLRRPVLLWVPLSDRGERDK